MLSRNFYIWKNLRIQEILQILKTMKLKSFFHKESESKDPIIYINLTNIIGIFPINKKNRSLDVYLYGFNCIFNNGLVLRVTLESNSNSVPPPLSELRDLFIHNLGLSIIKIDRDYYKDINFRFEML